MKASLERQPSLDLESLTPSETFARIRNFLAGQYVGATRDRSLLDQVLLCLFAKLYLETHDESRRLSPGATDATSAYHLALAELRSILGSDGLPDSELSLNEECLREVDRYLSPLKVAHADGDLVGDAYQCFLGSEARGQDGQFFTPPAAIRTLIALVNPRPGETVIDPACGAGGFLHATARHLIDAGLPVAKIGQSVFGIDKDCYLTRLARMRLSLRTLQQSSVCNGDSLAWTSDDPGSFLSRLKPGSYDVVLTNPPFGAKIVAASDAVRAQFILARRWVRSEDGRMSPSAEMLPSAPPQVLFVERCLSLVRPGGRIGMVVPESLLSGKNSRHVVEYLLENAQLDAVIGMPEALFKTSGKGGTHTKTALLVFERKGPSSRPSTGATFMAEAAWCGHDSRGRAIPNDDTREIVRNYWAWKANGSLEGTTLGHVVPSDALTSGLLTPRSHDPKLATMLHAASSSHLLVSIAELLAKRAISISTGDEVGKLAYGMGDIPFVRTSDLSNWEIKGDPKHGISRAVFDDLREKQDVREGDIFMVRDGTYLIGTCAMVTAGDTEIVFQSHLYKIRVNDNSLIDRFLLLALLSSRLVQRQIRTLTQSQDIIDSIGSRITELKLPIPRDPAMRRQVSKLVQAAIEKRVEAKLLAQSALSELGSSEGITHANHDIDSPVLPTARFSLLGEPPPF